MSRLFTGLISILFAVALIGFTSQASFAIQDDAEPAEKADAKKDETSEPDEDKDTKKKEKEKR